MRRVVVVLALLALAPFALAACGGDDEEEEPAPPAAEEQTGAEETVNVSADPGGALAFEQKTLRAPAGAVTFELENDASIAHDFCIERDGEDLGCTDEIANASDSLTVDLESGEYTFYCSVPGHREGGMEGTLTVN
jgi:uncharacterized cupredoxin-like copper-binding protein